MWEQWDNFLLAGVERQKPGAERPLMDGLKAQKVLVSFGGFPLLGIVPFGPALG